MQVESITKRSLQLFTNEHNAWGHMRDHGLGIRNNGEEQGWGLLLPALQAELSAGQLTQLRNVARATECDPEHSRLGPIYGEFLDSIQQDVERAARLRWHWEEKSDSGYCWSTFGHDGIVACLDEDYVRTGYLPEHDTSKWQGNKGNARFRLFQACLRRIQAKYNRGVRSKRIEKVQAELENLFRSGLTESDWAKTT